MNDYKKITDAYENTVPGQAPRLAAAGVAQAELFGWLFGKLVNTGGAREDEVEALLKELRHMSPDPAQSAIYDLVLNRMYEYSRKE
ncbi:MAG TPA: hypothetical protein VL625_04025 [Patescibacteria group bacterium]|nr:hypothetical protein [Patescibacteria group bacterium]